MYFFKLSVPGRAGHSYPEVRTPAAQPTRATGTAEFWSLSLGGLQVAGVCLRRTFGVAGRHPPGVLYFASEAGPLHPQIWSSGSTESEVLHVESGFKSRKFGLHKIQGNVEGC